MKLKKVLGKIHLLLGLVSGLVVFIISITGALYAFRVEIESATQTYRHVEAQDKAMLLPSQVFAAAKKAVPDTKIHGAIYGDKNESIEVIFYQAKPFYYGAAYVNPYSGEVLHTQDFLRSFFGLVLLGHKYLWMPPKISKPIISSMVILYFVLLATGIVMWWPRRKQTQGAFTLRKSKNKLVRIRDYHAVFAFYASFFVLILLLTGAVWQFEGFAHGIYKGLGGKKEAKWSPPKSDVSQAGLYTGKISPTDSIYKLVRNEFGNTASLEIHELEDEEASLLVEVNRDPSTYWKMDYLFFDQYTLQELEPAHMYQRFDLAGVPEKVRRLNYDVHVGSIGGFWGKLLAFLVSLCSASFPVTGFLFWWMKRKKKKANVLKKTINHATA